MSSAPSIEMIALSIALVVPLVGWAVGYGGYRAMSRALGARVDKLENTLVEAASSLNRELKETRHMLGNRLQAIELKVAVLEDRRYRHRHDDDTPGM